MALAIPPLDFGSMASSSSSGQQGPFLFGSYNASPITGSGNEQIAGGSIENGLPVWVWPVVLIGAYWLAKKRAK